MLMQDTYLIKIKIQETNHILKKYVAIICFGILLGITVLYVTEIWIFPIYLISIGIIMLLIQKYKMRNAVFVVMKN
jgi:hypothetical protein